MAGVLAQGRDAGPSHPVRGVVKRYQPHEQQKRRQERKEEVLDRLFFHSKKLIFYWYGIVVNTMYVYIVLTQTTVAQTLTVFQTLDSAYSFIKKSVQYGFHLESKDYVANELCDRSHVSANPVKVAWNADKSFVLSLCKSQLHTEYTDPTSHSIFQVLPSTFAE